MKALGFSADFQINSLSRYLLHDDTTRVLWLLILYIKIFHLNFPLRCNI
jgi:hypothetical protein